MTKDRRKSISSVILIRLQEIFNNLCKKWGVNLVEFKGEPDHVHLLIEHNPKMAPRIFVNNLKTLSSRLIRKEFLAQIKKYYWKDPVFWSRSYCIFSCAGAPLSILKQYIQGQAGAEE